MSRIAAVQWPIAPQQRQPPVLSPRLCQYGGCSRHCCRSLWRKIRITVAVLMLVAACFGNNFANPATEFLFC
jgi:hypothetical protein